MSIQYYPLDFDALQKGDRIEEEKVQEIVGLKPEHPNYQFGVMGLIARMESGCAERGKFFTIVNRKGCVCVLTDEEASHENDRRARNSRRAIGRACRRLIAVDPSGFDADLLKKHTRRCEMNSRAYTALQREIRRKKLSAPEAAERSTPAMIMIMPPDPSGKTEAE